jgi:outer membrane protein OmpA-like peptidoglycan-associated protein
MKTRTLLTVIVFGLLSQQPMRALADSVSSCKAGDPSCKPCRDSISGIAIPCQGDDLGKRVDDGRTYLEIIPPSSEWEGSYGLFTKGSVVVQTPLHKAAEPALNAEEHKEAPNATHENGPASQQPPAAEPAPAAPQVNAPSPPAVFAGPKMIARLGDTRNGANFVSGKDDLLPEAIERLDELVAKLRGKTNIHLLAVGHTDTVPIGRHEAMRRFGNNLRLSQARAKAVASYLQKALSLPDDALRTDGRGEKEPIADNGTASGRARNRRTEIAFWYDDDSTLPDQMVAVTATPLPALPSQLVAPLPVAPVTAPAVPAATQAVPPSPATVAGPGNERPLCGADGPADRNALPFRITVDGQPVKNDSLMPEADRQRCVDVALSKADIQLRYDPLQTKPALNVWTSPDGAVRGEQIAFGAYSNYLSWLIAAEIRIYPGGSKPKGRPMATIPARWDGMVSWTPPADAPDELLYLLRVYDGQGRFDETAVKSLRLLDRSRPHADGDKVERERLVGWGQDSRALATIPVSGGTVTVNGSGLLPGQTVTTLKQRVPVDANGRFAMRQILPAGPHTVSVEVSDPTSGTSRFSRNLIIPDNDWFYVAIGDLTVGQNHVSGPAKLVTADTGDTTTHYDNKVYLDGRGAFYLKGKIKGDYLLTASADTREQPIEDLFSNFGSKDPRYLLRRIDPDRYYPVYGDDSTLVEDAPTQGKFYVRLEKGDSHVLWGNFQTQWSGSELTQFSRSLYGGQLVLNSSGITNYGERKTNVNAFAAEPGTLQSREEFRGTGGSLYYLRHLDLTNGSERIWVEARDRDSGLVLERKQLVSVQDYDINYLQGRVTLRAPLASTTGGTTLVSSATLSGNPLYLVATYEYVPGLSAVDGIVFGGTASQWLGDYLRLGVTGYKQGENSQQQTLLGGDVTLRYTPGTYIKGEVARSDGPGAGQSNSITGGFDFSTNASVGQVAVATRIEAQLDLADLGAKGKGSFYWQDREAGFSGPGQLSPGEAVKQLGGRLTLPVGETMEADLKGDNRDSPSQGARSVEGNLFWKFAREWRVGVGVRDDERTNAVANASSILSENGHRTDAQLRLHYRPQVDAKGGETTTSANWDLYGFVQGTLAKDGDRRENNRAGIGGGWQLTDRFRLTAEASDGTGGVGAQLGGEYRVSDRSNVYLTFTSETERPDLNSRGRYTTGVAGTRYRVSDQMAVYGETKSTHGSGPESLVHAFGIDLAPNDRWTYGMKGEWGTVSDPASGDLERRAVGLTASYKQGKTNYGGGLEYRNETGTGVDRQIWLIRNALSYQAAPSWRLFCKANLSISSNNKGAFYDGDFVELVTGAAYRPVDNDRWNALFKYTYFQDVPSPGQVTANSTVADYSQRSHVLSVDAVYDLWKWLSIGAKFGWRGSQLRASKTEGEWFSSHAFLGVLRADLHLIRKWDVVAEARTLAVTEARDQRSGFLLAAYYHLNKNIKAGVGYNFTDFSDNLTDLSYRSHGWFFNIVGGL